MDGEEASTELGSTPHRDSFGPGAVGKLDLQPRNIQLELQRDQIVLIDLNLIHLCEF